MTDTIPVLVPDLDGDLTRTMQALSGWAGLLAREQVDDLLGMETAELVSRLDRLDELVRRRRSLTGEEIDELVELYQRVSTHLSVVRTSGQDPALSGRLSSLVARARSAVTGAHSSGWADVGGFFTRSFPATLYRQRW